MSQQGWTVAFDDGLVQRHTHCTLCGRTALAYWGLCLVNTLVVAYTLCRPCRQRDTDFHHIEACLEARYGSSADIS
jgi:hypothetical protein